jgi:hypothetical protein
MSPACLAQRKVPRALPVGLHLIRFGKHSRCIKEARKEGFIAGGQQIVATDRQIARLVYALCGLTDEEIRVVEGQ